MPRHARRFKANGTSSRAPTTATDTGADAGGQIVRDDGETRVSRPGPGLGLVRSVVRSSVARSIRFVRSLFFDFFSNYLDFRGARADGRATDGRR